MDRPASDQQNPLWLKIFVFSIMAIMLWIVVSVLYVFYAATLQG